MMSNIIEKDRTPEGMMMENRKTKIAYILGCFPANTPIFVINEIRCLVRLGFDITILSIHKSTDNRCQLGNKEWLPKTIYAEPPYSLPIILSHLYFIFKRPLVYFKLLFQYREFGGKKAFWEGVYFSKIINQLEIKLIHAHFAWKATDVARLISRFTGACFSFTVHAKDLYVEADHFKEKLEESKFVITCLNYNKALMIDRYGKVFNDKISVVYHGVDIERFNPKTVESKTGIDILSIGRLVEKKGFEYLIEAILLLKNEGLNINSQIIGKGENYSILEAMISDYGIKNCVKLVNPVRQEELIKFYCSCKIFVLPCVVAKDGDSDGIPNVLAEAMVMGLPVISTQLPNIAELIENGKDGILVPERNVQALAESIKKLLFDEKLREELGDDARKKIVKKFDAKCHIQDLASIFQSGTT